MVTSIRLSAETGHRLAALASRTGRSKSFYLREMIERGLEDLEDYYLGIEVLERIRKGDEEVFTTEEVRRHLGLDG